ncbi:unnamed protein product [Adineta steineri]|uniref:EGF-like domain-containing protein n=1 Tax=Adineta steineri TaxID=433720 RepID=A0A818JHH1_9BILA|nr:unnamed protein product [Adineta steineri]CAF3544209.1 unnamed protein product [Adineta steineri]
MTYIDCSTYDPCGRYGYCGDDVNGNWECQCKFWWTGTLCNKQSSSGIQVIVLGVLVGVLLIIFYGLSIFFSTRRNKQETTIDKKRNDQNIGLNPNLTHVVIVNVKRSARLSSCFIAILMLIVTTVALVTKWSLVQPIHNELVKKYQEQDLLFYTRKSFCRLIDFEDFNMLTFPIACLLVIIFIIFSKRTSCMRQKLKGYIAPVIPIDFYMHIKRKFAAVVFAIIADELVDIVSQVLLGETSNDDGVIVVYILRIAKVLVIGLRYYPVLSAVYIDSILALLCATFYAWLDFSLTVVDQSLCQSDFYPSDDNFDDTNGTDLEILFNYYGTGHNLILITILSDIPRYICWSYIVIKLPMLLITKIHKTIKHKQENRPNRLHLTREEKILLHSSAPHSVEMTYIRNLFRSINQRSTSRSFLARLIPKFIYQWRDDFRFSSRILCIYSTIFLVLVSITIQACILVLPYMDIMQQYLQQQVDTLTGVSSLIGVQREFPLPNFVPPYVIAILAAFIITIIQLLTLLANIRRNLLQIFRSDGSEIPVRDKSKYLSYTTGNFHFAGFFIGYVIWGYILTAVFAFIVCICIDAFMTYGSVMFLEKILKSIIPVLLLIIFKQYLNKLLARYAFLQHYGDVLAINNRRILMIFLYFNFFLDSFLGFISSIIRIIQSVIGGCLYMSRLDYSPMGRKLETFDSGFSAYCGFIHIEAVHRNSIMLVVVGHLYSAMKAKQYLAKSSTIIVKSSNPRNKDYSSKAIRKWHLTVLLLRNPRLTFLRKHALLLLQNEDKQVKALNRATRLSYSEQQRHRFSLISENDLEHAWQKNIN